MRSRTKKGIGGGSFLKSAALIAAGGFLAKLLGALYRIPLTNLIGGKGLGLYQLVYPVYCLLLTVSATGIPSSIAKLTAEAEGRGENSRSVLKTAMKLFLIIGGVGTVFMVATAPFLAKLQGSEEVLQGYFTLAPSVLLVSAISVFRGWFQGHNKMFPTAASEVIEQFVKVGVGLLFAYLFRDNIARAVVYLLLAVSISEGVALLFMWLYFKRCNGLQKTTNEGGRVALSVILRLSIPVTLSSILLPVSALLDSVLVPRLLGAYTGDAITLYGLFSGGAVTIVNLPVSVCYGLAAASIPRIAGAGKEGARGRILFSLLITILVGGGSAVGLYLFAQPIVKLIFRSLQGEELSTLISLVKGLSLSALTLSCVQTLSACLTAQGKPQYAAISMAVAMTVKTAVYLFLLPNAEVSVFGMVVATNIAYAVAFFLNLLYNLKVSKKKTPPKQPVMVSEGGEG
ncbi:MAG: polysaccharide biosynthesis protein [Clostridia bacterium]|nr:polysaccharide biosynthesis protein [Clostridia bacterium]